MKLNSTILFPVFALIAVLAPDFSRAQLASYAITQRGPDWRVLSKTTVEHGTNHIHSYTELATGLNFQNSFGQWTESKEQITILPTGGAAATQGRHKVYFPADIYNGVLEVVTPDGRHLRSRPLGVSYDDGSNTVFIAELKHAQGYLTSSNQVTYRDAFTGFKADLVCTYRRGGFECDLVFRQQPPPPDQYGLDESFTTLEMVTEFFNTQDPQEIPAAYDDWFGLQDHTLKFGKLTMSHGKAFAYKGTNTNLPTSNSQAAVYKSWVHLDGRTFLIEQVPLLDIAEDLNALPLTARNEQMGDRKWKLAKNNSPNSHLLTANSSRRVFPASHEFIADTNQILVAFSDLNNQPGVVLDYTTAIWGDWTDLTLYSNETYFISGTVNLSGTTTIQGGAVLKYNNDGCLIPDLDTLITCPTDANLPAVLTSVDDNSVGAAIGSGSPAINNATYFFFQDNASLDECPISNLRIFYAGCAIQDGFEDGYVPIKVTDSQFIKCGSAFHSFSPQLNCQNVLFNGCGIVMEAAGSYSVDVQAIHTTVDQCGIMIRDDGAMGGSVELTNSIFSQVTNMISLYSPSYDYFYELYPTWWARVTLQNSLLAGASQHTTVVQSQDSYQISDPAGIYAPILTAENYLAASSPYRDVGTTSINSFLLAELQTMTTYAPQDGGWPDTNAPDLGYHYPVNEDSDHDGLPDWWEWKYFGNYTHTGSELDVNGNTLVSDYQNGRNPLTPVGEPGLLGRWHFDTTNWFGAQGQQPLVATNLGLVSSWSSNAMNLDADDAVLTYNLVEANGHTNLNLQCGTVRLWFCPNWSSANLGGIGLNNVPMLIESDDLHTQAYWVLFIYPDGNSIVLSSGDGTDWSDYMNEPIAWKSNQWHQVALTYTPTNSIMYIDGMPVTNGVGIAYVPVANSFYIGNSIYSYPAHGRFDELDTFDYPLSAERIAADYHSIVDPDSDSNGLPDFWEMENFGHIGVDANADPDGDGYSNLQEYQLGFDPNNFNSNIVSFSFSVSGQYVSTNIISASLTISDGAPFYYAVLVDSTNFATTNWTAYTSSNLTVNLGSTQGSHDVWIGLRGYPTNAPQTWHGTNIVLDFNPPTIAITSPVDKASFNAARVNVTGHFSGNSLKQPININGFLPFVNGTNFEVVNMPLEAGTNTITATIEDLTGYIATSTVHVIAITNTDGSLNNPVQLQADPVGGFAPLPVAFSIQTNAPGTMSQVFYDFNGDDIADFATNNLDPFTYTYTAKGEDFPVVTVQTTVGRFSSVGGWNAVALDPTNQPIRINVEGEITQVSVISITDPVDIKWAGTNLYVLSGSTATITEYATNGSSIRSLSGIGSSPSGLDVDTNGNVYVAVTGGNQVWKFNPTSSSFQADTNFGIGGFIGLTNGASGTNTSDFNAPFDVAVSPDGQEISVSDSGNNRIQQFSATKGAFISILRTNDSDIGQLNLPKGLTYDSADTLYIVDAGNSRIVLAQGGFIEGATGTNGTALGQFSDPTNISFGERGIYVADTGNNRIQKFDSSAPEPFSITPSSTRYSYSTNFSRPLAVAAMDDLLDEKFYVADTGNDRVILYQLTRDDPTPPWTNLTARVASGDISSGVSSFSMASTDDYRDMFISIGTNDVASAVGQIGALTPVYIHNNKAEYYFTNAINGQIVTFPVEFVKENGAWKILEF